MRKQLGLERLAVLEVVRHPRLTWSRYKLMRRGRAFVRDTKDPFRPSLFD